MDMLILNRYEIDMQVSKFLNTNGVMGCVPDSEHNVTAHERGFSISTWFCDVTSSP